MSDDDSSARIGGWQFAQLRNEQKNDDDDAIEQEVANQSVCHLYRLNEPSGGRAGKQASERAVGCIRLFGWLVLVRELS